MRLSARNKILGLIFLVAVLAAGLFVAERLLLPAGSKGGAVAALLDKSKAVAKPSLPKPSAAVLAPPSPPAPSAVQPFVARSSATPSSNPQAQGTIPSAGTAPGARQEPFPAAKGAATTTENHLPELRLESGVRLWIHVTSINRQPDGSFTFRGNLLQPLALANANQLDQGTELAGSGAANNGHVTVVVREFTVGGTNYALQQDNAIGSNRPPGTGLAVELAPGKLLEVWLASWSVYRKTR